VRYVPAYCIREGMVVAKNIYGKSNQLMLKKDTIMNEKYIKSIKNMGYNGIYIEDDISRDIEVVNTISDNLRNTTVNAIKDMFIQDRSIENAKNKTKAIIENYKKVELFKGKVSEIVEEILKSDSLMVNMVDLKYFDDYTYLHSLNVTVLSIAMGIALKLDKDKLFKLGLGAIFHDIGKMFIDKAILLKEGKLNDEELKEYKKHPELGYGYMKKEYNIPITSYIGILEHHERYNGTGYPDQKKGNKISQFGSIIGIADLYDSLSSEKPNMPALLPSEAMELIMGASGRLFDPELVTVFTRKVAPYPVGTCVKLSNNYMGIVVENFEDACLRPKIRVFQNGDINVEPFIVNLKDDFSYMNVIISEVAKM
jgi:HD-GYP domain-containing protein (c-di-GMP phosphodiesterase class II)